MLFGKEFHILGLWIRIKNLLIFILIIIYYLLLFWGFLEIMKQTFKWNITRLRIQSGRRQSSWLFYNFGQGFEIGTTEDNYLVSIVLWLSCSYFGFLALGVSKKPMQAIYHLDGMYFKHWTDMFQIEKVWFLLIFQLWDTRKRGCAQTFQNIYQVSSEDHVCTVPCCFEAF